jgi:arabinofuranosyltransferase
VNLVVGNRVLDPTDRFRIPTIAVGGRQHRWLYWGLLAGAAAIYVARCWQFDFIADDAFISFRYARNVARGLGFVFNPGDRVEGYSNFLLVALLAGLNRLGVDIVTAGRICSMTAGTAMVFLTATLVRRIMPGRPWVDIGAAFLVAVNPFVATWGASGLETTMFGALLLLTLNAFVGGGMTASRFARASVCALLLGATRPEGVVFYLVLVATFFARKHDDERPRPLALIFPGLLLYLLVGGAYFFWRWHYFGALLPNTYSAKSPFSLDQLPIGAAYVGGFVKNPFVVLSIPFAWLGVHAVWRRSPAVVVLLGVLLLMVIGEGGDGLPMYRFLVPAVPLLAALIAVGIAMFCDSRDFSMYVPTIVTASLVVLSLFPLHDEQYQIYLYQRDLEIPRWSAAGAALARTLPRDAVVAAVPVGALGWYSDLRVLDMLGLTDPVIARSPVDPAVNWAGHQKHNGKYVVARRPAAILLGNILVTDSPDPPHEALARITPAFFAREGDVLDQPEFGANYRLATLPVGQGWFLHYYLRRDIEAPQGSAQNRPHAN